MEGALQSTLQQAGCIARIRVGSSGSFGWPSRQILLQGHLFDQSLINQALEIIEKRGGDFEIISFSVAPNDQNSEFNFKRTSSVALRVFGVDAYALDDIISRLQQLVDVLESAEGKLTLCEIYTYTSAVILNFRPSESSLDISLSANTVFRHVRRYGSSEDRLSRASSATRIPVNCWAREPRVVGSQKHFLILDRTRVQLQSSLTPRLRVSLLNHPCSNIGERVTQHDEAVFCDVDHTPFTRH